MSTNARLIAEAYAKELLAARRVVDTVRELQDSVPLPLWFALKEYDAEVLGAFDMLDPSGEQPSDTENE